jgi:hypothetical protein
MRSPNDAEGIGSAGRRKVEVGSGHGDKDCMPGAAKKAASKT